MTAPEDDGLDAVLEASRQTIGKLTADAFDQLEGPLLGAVLLIAEEHPTEPDTFRVMPFVPDDQPHFVSRGIVAEHISEVQSNHVISYLDQIIRSDGEEEGDE